MCACVRRVHTNRLNIFVCIYTGIYRVCVCVRVGAYTCIYIHIYIQVYVYTHARTPRALTPTTHAHSPKPKFPPIHTLSLPHARASLTYTYLPDAAVL